MNKQFTDEQLATIRDQALVYQCACPAQVSVAIDSIRHMYARQLQCLDVGSTDHAVHARIKQSAEACHAELERCLNEILHMEGWDMQTMRMPADLQKRRRDEV